MTASRKYHLHLPILCLSLTAFANETIYDFSYGDVGFNETLPPEKRGVTVIRPEEGAQGLLIHYEKYAVGNATWPYVDIKASAMRGSDWSGYITLVIKSENPGPAITDFKVTLRDKTGKRHTESVALPANATSDVGIDLTKLADKIELAQISRIDFALAKPTTATRVKLISLALTKDAMPSATASAGAATATDPNRIVTRHYDLRGDIMRGATITQGLRISANDFADIQVSNDAWLDGAPRYPSLTLRADQGGALNQGDLGYMTHIAYNLEQVAGYGNYLGMMIAAGGKRMWHGVGTLGEGFPSNDSQQLWESALDLGNAESLVITSVGSFNAHTFRINQLQFEFRPEALLDQVNATLAIVSRQALDQAERAQLDAMTQALAAAYAKVKGGTFRYGDAMDFNRRASITKHDALALLRRHNDRILPAMTAKQFGVGIADSMTSVFLEGPGSEIVPATAHTLDMAGNEYESFQVVVAATDSALLNVRVEVETPLDARGNAIAAEVAVIGHALNKRHNYPQEHIGHYPNFIIPYQQSCEVAAHKTVAFWVRLKTPRDAPHGTYRATLRVSADSVAPYSFPLLVNVFNFSLPDGTVLPTAFHVLEPRMTGFYKANDEPEKSQALARNLIDVCADYKIPFNHLYWEQTTADSRRNYFDKLKYLHDKGLLTSFAWCTLQLTSTPGHSRFNTSYWMDPDDPEVDRFITSVKEHLDKWLPLCREFGFADKGYIYAFDEGSLNAVTARILAEIKQSYPDIPVMTCGRLGSPDAPAVKDVDIWVPIAPRFIARPELVAANRAAGRQVWWYVCNFPRPPHPTLMLDVPAIMPRLLMGMMTQKYRPDGFLYWGVIAWRGKKHDVISYGPRTNWDSETVAGDSEEGNLFGPGLNYTLLPTIRVENYRDGCEDHWYYELLARAIANHANDVDETLLAEAKAALAVPDIIVKGSCEYTRDPQLIRFQRHKVASLLEKLRQK